jgi:hypothetical protein
MVRRLTRLILAIATHRQRMEKQSFKDKRAPKQEFWGMK